MNNDLKIKVVEHAQKWAKDNKLTQAELSKKTGVNAGYLSNMLRNIFIVEVEGKDVFIADKWFYQLADRTGFAVKKSYWATVQTREFEMIIHELTVAKRESKVTTIINDTGLGKTFTVDKFVMVNALHTYSITVNSMHKLRDIINELANLLGTPIRHNSLDTFFSIIKRLRELKMMGHQPLVIIDEAENLKLPVIQMLKGLYDGVIEYASIVMIGTSQLTDALQRLSYSNKNGAPQFFRRIKAGIRVIPAHKDFKPFFEKFKIQDKGLRELLTRLCNNYGELHDYLEPALREADETGEQLNEQFFRLMYNLPKI